MIYKLEFVLSLNDRFPESYYEVDKKILHSAG